MNTNRYKPQSENLNTTEKLFFNNEIKTNRMAATCLLVVIGLVFIFGVLCIGGQVGHVYILSGVILLVTCAVGLLLLVVMRVLGFDDLRTKHIALLGLIFIGGITFFLYPLVTVFLSLGPIIISIKYYNPKLTLRVTLISWLVFLAGEAGNILVDSIFSGLNDLHMQMAFNYWSNIPYVTLYYVLPRTGIFILEGFVGYKIAKSGRDLVIEQAEVSTDAAFMSAELHTASKIQESSLPVSRYTTEDRNIEICAGIRTARDVGGDFYDYFMINDYLLFVVVADVSDKGLPSAMFGIEAQSYLRFAFSEKFRKDINGSTDRISIKDAMNAVNRQLVLHNMDGMFVTLWAGCFDIRTGVGKFVNAGHCCPYIRHADGTVSSVTNEPQIFLGVFRDTSLETNMMRLKEGDTLILYTDGATDARNDRDLMFGEERLIHAIKNASLEKNETISESIRRSVSSDIDSFIGDKALYDDITLLTLHFKGRFSATKVSLNLETGAECSSRAIDFFNAHISDYNCPVEIRRNLNTIIDEICTNITMYAYNGESGPLRVDIELERNYTALTFIDKGIRFNPLDTEDPNVEGEPKIGGLGIYLVKNLSDHVEYKYENEKNILTICCSWYM